MIRSMLSAAVALSVSAVWLYLAQKIKMAARSVLPAQARVEIAVAIFIGLLAIDYLLRRKPALAWNWWLYRWIYTRELLRYLQNLFARHSLRERNALTEIPMNGSPTRLVSYLLRLLETSRDDPPRVLVLGEHGTGKSIAMATLAAELARRSRFHPRRPFPIYCQMADFHDGDFDKFLSTRIALITTGKSGSSVGSALDHLLRKRRLILVLDGLDETPDGQVEKARNWLGDLSFDARRVAVIATSRSRNDNVTRSFQEKATQKVEIQDLGDEAVSEMIGEYAAGKLDA